MTLELTLQQIYDSPISAAIRENTNAFPIIETFHVIAITAVLGTIMIVDLRLLGFTSHRRGANRLIAELLPYTWVAFALAVVSGGLLFVSNAPAYAANVEFQLKLVAIAAAGINMLIFHGTAYRRIADWDTDTPPPTSVKVSGVISLILWVTVIFLGRWIGFTLDVLF
ncbi:MAG: DUF6644 family protein [Sphingobium sp.]